MIERLRAGEGARLRTLRLRALADAPDAFGATLEDAERRRASDWEAQVVRLPTFVWREGAADLGMARGAPHDDDPEVAYLISMWVAPEGRGRGVGAGLVGEVAAWARGHGFRRLVLDVAEGNAGARRLYERCGFVSTGATGTLPPPRSHVRELEMALDLTLGRPLDPPPTRPRPPTLALELTVLPWTLSVCRLPAGAQAPAWLDGAPFTVVARTPEETSLVCASVRVPAGVRSEPGWRALRVAGPLDFALTGVLRSLLAPLADAGVAVFALSTFDTDYVLVKEPALADAVAALEAAGHRVGRTGDDA